MKLVVQGREAYAYTGGKPFDPSLPTLVLVHGAVNDHSVFTLLARWFAHHGWGVLAVDLPGHMRSEGPALASVTAMADWVLALMDAAGVQRAAVAGHSLGSLVALECAARAPQRTTHLMMLGTCVPMPVPQALLDLSRSDVMAAIDRVVVFSFSTLAAKPFHIDFAACNDYRHGLESAAQVACPAHLVIAEADQMTLPRNARDVASALKARVHTVPGGHYLMQESPDAVLMAMRAALGA